MVEKNGHSYKKYIEENEEIRSWFRVTSNRKKGLECPIMTFRRDEENM